VEIDETGRRNGRGAYLCARRTCWDTALDKDRLGRALRTNVLPEDREALRQFAEQFEAVGAEA
jgi:predicted RNA-binding protein YlxR (DUF448 family)